MRGLMDRLELGLLYLDQKRWEEADHLFMSLINDGPRAYATLGQAGHAIVLAYQEKAAESNRVFLSLAGKKGADRDKLPLYTNPRLRRWIAEALERNRANATAKEPFPAELEPLRRLPAAEGVRKGLSQKPPSKSQ